MEEEAVVRTQVRFGWTMALNAAFLREAKKGDGLFPFPPPLLLLSGLSTDEGERLMGT